MRNVGQDVEIAKIRQAARDEALDVVETAFRSLHGKIAAMYGVEQNALRAGLLYGIMGAIKDVEHEVKVARLPREPVSRAARPPVDMDGPHCGESTCTRRHSVLGRHIS